MISIDFRGFTPWETQLGHLAGGPATSRPCLVAEALSDLWDGGPHLEMEAVPAMNEIPAEVVVYLEDLQVDEPKGTAMLYREYFDRLKKVVGFAPVNDPFLARFEDDRGHPARIVRGATGLMAQGEGAL